MSASKFEINDDLSFAENLEKFSEILKKLDPELGPVLSKEIDTFVDAGAYDRGTVLDRLFDALKESKA